MMNPYPGLRPFEQNEVLFGRDSQVDELIRMLKAERIVVVTGVSGSGKSSLIRAGLVPALIQGLLPIDQNEWRVAIVTPGNGPIRGLHAALETVDVVEQVEPGTNHSDNIELGCGGTALMRAVESSIRGTAGPSFALFLLVDQFEDLFRYAREISKNEANAFVELLSEAVHQRTTPIYIVVTMRSDFLGEAARFRDLPELINRSNYLIPRMTRGELTQAIVRPAESQGVSFSPKLVDRLLNDIKDDPSRLPLLQHSLNRTWEKWMEAGQSGSIEISHYRQSGTIDGEDGRPGALHVHAQEIYECRLSDTGRQIAEALFRCITERSPHGQCIRRPCNLELLQRVIFAPVDVGIGWRAADSQRAELREVIDSFRQDSFLRARENGVAGEIVDLSHESLICGWATLQRWVDQEAGRVKNWAWLVDMERRHREESGPLLRGAQIRMATKLMNGGLFNRFWVDLISFSPQDETLERVRSLVAASEKHEQAEQHKKQADEKAKMRSRKRRFAGVILAALSMALVAAWALELARQNEKLARYFEELAIRAQDTRDRSLKALSYANEKLKSGGGRERVLALRALARALRLDPGNAAAIVKVCDLLSRADWCSPLTSSLRLRKGEVGLLAAEFLPNDMLVVVSRDGNLYHADERAGTLEKLQSLLPIGWAPLPNVASSSPLSYAKFSEDATHLVVFYKDDSTLPASAVWRWNEQAFVQVETISQPNERSGVRQVAWKTDGKMFMLTRRDSPLCEFFAFDGTKYRPMNLAAEKVVAAGFSPNDHLLAIATVSDGPNQRVSVQLRRVDIATSVPEFKNLVEQYDIPITWKPSQLTFGPGENELIMTAWGISPSVILDRKSRQTRPAFFGSMSLQDTVVRLAFDLPGGKKQEASSARDFLVAAVFTNRIQLFERSDTEHPALEAICPGGFTGSAAFAPHRDRLVTLSGSSPMALDTLRVWDVRRREKATFDSSSVTGNDLAPPWLADLATVVAGQGGDPEGEDVVTDTSGSQVRKLADLAASYSNEQVRGKYEEIWRRYFPDSALTSR